MSDLTREQVDMLVGATVLEFGTSWCGHCLAARSLIDAVLARRPEVRHVQIEDGKGKRLGRTFGVKLWPTFIFYRDGSEVARVVRPRMVRQVHDAMAKLVTMPSSELAVAR